MFRSDPLYDLIVVVGHNCQPVEFGMGSAIFLHAWRGPRQPTAGCVAFDPLHLMWIVSRLKPGSRLIVRPPQRPTGYDKR